MKYSISLKKLAKFLNESNKSTYANKDAPKSEPSRLKSEDYHFERGDLIYHDSYFGGRDFIGEEIIYEKQKPVWGANYFGFVIDAKIDEKTVYSFLRKALMQECNNLIPVRGPAKFSEGKWTYTFLVEGTLANFKGKEEIIFDGKVIYHCLVHGGFIK